MDAHHALTVGVSLRPRRAWLRWSLVFFALLFLSIVVFYPLAGLAWYLPQAWSDLVFEDAVFFAKHLGVSVLLGFLSASVCALLGLPLAWCLWVLPQRWSRGLLLGLILPFMVPPVVAALAVLSLFGPQAWFLLGQGEGLSLLLLGNIFYNLGLITWFCYTALQRVSATALEAARSLGSSGFEVCTRVLWPLLRPSLGAAWLLVFLLCANSFGLPLLLGGSQWATLEVLVYRVTLYEMNLGLGAGLALVQLLLSVVLVLAYARLDKGQCPSKNTRTPYWPLPRWGLVWVWVYVLGASALVFGPLVALVLKSLEYGFAPFLQLGRHPGFALALGNTLFFAALALPLALALAVGICTLEWWAKCLPRAGLLVRLLAYIPYLVSAAVLSLALLLAYASWAANLVLLLGGYALMAYSFIARNLSLALQQSRAQATQVAYSLGAGPWRAFWHGLWPQIAPALQSGIALALATMLGEFAVTLFLQRPEWATLSTLTYELMGRPGLTNMAQARAAAVLLLLLALGLFLLVFARVLPAVSGGLGFMHGRK